VIVAATWDPGGRVGLELLGGALRLAGALGTEAVLVALGKEASGAGPVSALAELARERGAQAVLLPADEWGGELAPRVAERLGGTAVTHVVAVEVEDGRPRWTRPVFGGKALADVRALAEPVVATVRRGAFEPAAPDHGLAPIELRPVPDGAVELISFEPFVEGVTLEEAPVVVAGGAGLGAAEAFEQLEELATLLGGAVGASLAAVDAGWAAPEQQVGLTGKVVSPDVYLALGISGASQHLAGIGGAKAVVAVNTDPEAPIFSRARLGVVMDCRVFLAALLHELRPKP
jgi:electron transfer flavoprotein alpha subunit